MPALKLKIVTPERVVYEDVVDSVTAPTTSGEVTILKDHITMTSVLQPGEVRTRTGSEETLLAVSTGFLQVRPGNEIVLLADTAERADELDLKKIEEARERARQLLEEKRLVDTEAFAAAAAALERELARYKVAVKKSRHKSTINVGE